jgi:Zn-dependent protease
MDPNLLFTAGIELLIVWLAISLHEASHAWVARRCGDPTAAEQGRASLNPLRHLDLFGSLLFPLVLAAFGASVFGWGRPTPVDIAKLRRPARDEVLVALAGVAANALVVVVAMVALAVAVKALGGEARQAAMYTVLHRTADAARLSGFPVMFTLVQLATINAFLVLFNLLPLPPLDGGQVALMYLPEDWAARLSGIRPFGLTVAILLAAFVLIPLFLLPFAGILGLVISFS